MSNRVKADSTHIGKTVLALRTARGLSQAELASRIGVSQARISRIERGEASLWAEEFLVLLAFFNVSVDAFQAQADEPRSLQNALARFGAAHLREDPGVLVQEEHATPQRALTSVLLAPRSERQVTALAPVLLVSADDIPLAAVQHKLQAAGVPNRLGWLCENTVRALDEAPVASADERRALARARLLLQDFLAKQTPEHLKSATWDAFDRGIRSAEAQAEVRSAASPISRRWRIESRLSPEEFSDAIRSARESVP